MKISTAPLLTVFLTLAVCAWPSGAAAWLSDPMAVAGRIQAAILREDVKFFMKHMQGSTYFVDELYTQEELVQLFKDKKSWLQRNLFVENNSVKAYLEAAQDLKIVHMVDGWEDVFLFQSSNHPPHEWPWCSIKPRGNSWVFCDMFAYR